MGWLEIENGKNGVFRLSHGDNRRGGPTLPNASRLCRVYWEGMSTQRGYAATKSQNISRKGAKAAKKKMNPNLAFLASWRENNPCGTLCALSARNRKNLYDQRGELFGGR